MAAVGVLSSTPAIGRSSLAAAASRATPHRAGSAYLLGLRGAAARHFGHARRLRPRPPWPGASARPTVDESLRADGFISDGRSR